MPKPSEEKMVEKHRKRGPIDIDLVTTIRQMRQNGSGGTAGLGSGARGPTGFGGGAKGCKSLGVKTRGSAGFGGGAGGRGVVRVWRWSLRGSLWVV